MRGAEHEHAARADRDFLPGFRVAPDALALAAHRKAAKGRNLDHLAPLQRIRNLGDHRLDQFGRLVARQADLLIDRFGELSAGNRIAGHNALPACAKVSPAEKPRQIPKRWVWFREAKPWLLSYHLTSAAPQVRPPPSASISTRSPGWMRPSPTASSSASGIDAAEVLAWRSIVTTVCPGFSFSRLPIASMIRKLAWCGTSQSMSAPVRPLAASASSTASDRCCTAWRNASRPSIRRWPVVPVEDGPPST